MVWAEITYPIYKQASAGLCWSYACLNTLQRMWVNISEEEMLSYWPMFWFSAMEQILVSKWLIKSLSYLIAPRRIDNYLKIGMPLVCLIYGNSFDSVRKSPHIQSFKGKMQHFVCIVEDLGDKYKVVDQQGENFADHWYWYFKKEDIKGNVRIAKINLYE